MARTLLLRSILRLAGQYRAAGKMGLPIQAVQERQALAPAIARSREQHADLRIVQVVGPFILP